MSSPPSMAVSAVVPVPATIQAALAGGAVEGTILAAPLAPASGHIDGAPESLVVVTIKSFWQSKTVVWARNLVIAAFGVAFVVAFEPYVTGVKAWDSFTLAEGWKVFAHAWEVAAISAVFLWFKTRDNNVTNLSAKPTGGT